MKCYKGFNKGLICKDKQYKENTVFEEKIAKICEAGMHYCKNPMDILNYYGFVGDDGEFNEFAEVEPMGDVDTDENEKFCTNKLKIGKKLEFNDFLKECIDYVTKTDESDFYNICRAQIGSSGDSAKIGSSGKYAKIGSSGDSAQIGSSGNFAKIGSSGDSAKIGSSGNFAQIGSSGDSAQIGSSGNSAQIGSSGDSAKIGSSGDSAQIGSSGDSAQINSLGADSVICCAGINAIAKAKKGSWITLAEWEYNEEKDRYVPLCVKTEQVDGERIKEDTFYKLKNGEFEEVE